MTTAFDNEDWEPRFIEEIDSAFTDSPFGYTDPDVIEAEVEKLRAFLDSTPSAER